MRLLTFHAKDKREALANARAELGPYAVIVTSEEVEGGVMVRAAVEETASESLAENLAIFSGWHAAMTADVEPRMAPVHPLRSDRAEANPASGNFSRAELLEILRFHRVPDALAHALAEAAAKSGLSDMTLALASAFDRRMKAEPLDIKKSCAFLLVGPHGAGKSAAAARIAAHARDAGRAVKLIAADANGAGATARLEAFAGHVGVPMAIAATAEELASEVRDCARDNILAIIDTAGFDPCNFKARNAFAALASIGHIEAVGVVSATGDAEETADITAALASLGARHIIVTGLDIARRLGALAAAATGDAAIAHVTRSSHVAGGLETLTPLSLATALHGRLRPHSAPLRAVGGH